MTKVKKELKYEVDRLAEATGGKFHWDDPGMDDFETGWEDFPLGARVEVRIRDNVWKKGTVVETPKENNYNDDRCAIVVKCDKKNHNFLEFYDGRGVTIPVYMNTRRGILLNIRKFVK